MGLQRVGQTEQLNNNNSVQLYDHVGFPGGSDGKESACNAGGLGSIPGLGRFPGEGNSHPLQCYGLESSVDRGAWQVYSPWGHKELDSAYKKR